MRGGEREREWGGGRGGSGRGKAKDFATFLGGRAGDAADAPPFSPAPGHMAVISGPIFYFLKLTGGINHFQGAAPRLNPLCQVTQ